MLRSTLKRLRCPACAGEVVLETPESATEVSTGELKCVRCASTFPIIAGVALLVEDVEGYLTAHVKGISRLVPDSAIPKVHRRAYGEAKAEIAAEHIEEDLEAERVVALYVMNHYLNTAGKPWWRPQSGSFSPLIDSLVRENWDQGPLNKIATWLRERNSGDAVVEIGCGVGGLACMTRGHVGSYLGIDNSFASVALARHLSLGAPYLGEVRIPEDLFAGPVSRTVKINTPQGGPENDSIDFVVGDIEALPVIRNEFDVSVALNAIDMLSDPSHLPELQRGLLKLGGVALQSCPYIWHAQVAEELRARIPKEISNSASAVEWLYKQAGFEISQRVEHLPWLFFKHARQLEIYSVHLFLATFDG